MLKSDGGAVVSGLVIIRSVGEVLAFGSSSNIVGRDFARAELYTVEGKYDLTRYGGAVLANLGAEFRAEGDPSLGSLQGGSLGEVNLVKTEFALGPDGG